METQPMPRTGRYEMMSPSEGATDFKESSTSTGSRFLDGGMEFLETHRSLITEEEGRRLNEAFWQNENELKAEHAAFLEIRARLVELLKQIKEMNRLEFEEHEKAKRRFMRPVNEKQREVDKLREEIKSVKSLLPHREPHVTELILTDPGTRTRKLVKVVDFAAMKPNEVHDYDGRYGGEEAIYVQKRKKAALEREKSDIAQGWKRDPNH